MNTTLLRSRFFSTESKLLSQRKPKKKSSKKNLQKLQMEKNSLKKYIKTMIFHLHTNPRKKTSSLQMHNFNLASNKPPKQKENADFASIFHNFSKKITQKIQTLSQKIDSLQLIAKSNIKLEENNYKIAKPSQISEILQTSQEQLAKIVPPSLEQNSNLFISNIQKNSLFFSIFNKHFTNIYSFMQELSENHYENLYKSLIDILNEFLMTTRKFPDNNNNFLSDNSSLPSFPSFPDIFRKKEENNNNSDIFLKDNVRSSYNFEKSENFDRFGGSNPEYNIETENENYNYETNFEYFRRNSRKKWGPTFLNTGKIPPPLYELFKKQRFSYKVMPSLKEKYKENLSMKDVKDKTVNDGKNKEDRSLSVVKDMLKDRTYSFKRKPEEKTRENQGNSHGNSPKTQLNQLNHNGTDSLIRNQGECSKTGGDGLNLFTNFKARMSQKYKK